jgi:hypothetical protein
LEVEIQTPLIDEGCGMDFFREETDQKKGKVGWTAIDQAREQREQSNQIKSLGDLIAFRRRHFFLSFRTTETC